MSEIGRKLLKNLFWELFGGPTKKKICTKLLNSSIGTFLGQKFFPKINILGFQNFDNAWNPRYGWIFSENFYTLLRMVVQRNPNCMRTARVGSQKRCHFALWKYDLRHSQEGIDLCLTCNILGFKKCLEFLLDPIDQSPNFFSKKGPLKMFRLAFKKLWLPPLF